MSENPAILGALIGNQTQNMFVYLRPIIPDDDAYLTVAKTVFPAAFDGAITADLWASSNPGYQVLAQNDAALNASITLGAAIGLRLFSQANESQIKELGTRFNIDGTSLINLTATMMTKANLLTLGASVSSADFAAWTSASTDGMTKGLLGAGLSASGDDFGSATSNMNELIIRELTPLHSSGAITAEAYAAALLKMQTDLGETLTANGASADLITTLNSSIGDLAANSINSMCSGSQCFSNTYKRTLIDLFYGMGVESPVLLTMSPSALNNSEQGNNQQGNNQQGNNQQGNNQQGNNQQGDNQQGNNQQGGGSSPTPSPVPVLSSSLDVLASSGGGNVWIGNCEASGPFTGSANGKYEVDTWTFTLPSTVSISAQRYTDSACSSADGSPNTGAGSFAAGPSGVPQLKLMNINIANMTISIPATFKILNGNTLFMLTGSPSDNVTVAGNYRSDFSAAPDYTKQGVSRTTITSAALQGTWLSANCSHSDSNGGYYFRMGIDFGPVGDPATWYLSYQEFRYGSDSTCNNSPTPQSASAMGTFTIGSAGLEASKALDIAVTTGSFGGANAGETTLTRVKLTESGYLWLGNSDKTTRPDGASLGTDLTGYYVKN